MAAMSVDSATNLTRAMRGTLAVIAAIAWLALVLQLLIMLQQAAPGTLLRAVVNYLSFFTILTNLLVALCATVPLLARRTAAGRFFFRPSTQSATAVYIAIVAITYSVLLRHLWNPQGMLKVADVLLHDVVPVLYLAYWIFLVPKFSLRWTDSLRWLAFPVAYMAYILARGVVSHWYPYYFIDVDTIGLSRSLIHAAGLLLAFFGLSLFFIAIGRWTARSYPARAPTT